MRCPREEDIYFGVEKSPKRTKQQGKKKTFKSAEKYDHFKRGFRFVPDALDAGHNFAFVHRFHFLSRPPPI